jgi:hypothetical protein
MVYAQMGALTDGQKILLAPLALFFMLQPDILMLLIKERHQHKNYHKKCKLTL